MEERIIEIAVQVFGVSASEITINSKIQEVEAWDSLTHIQLIAELEEQLDIMIPFEDVAKIACLKDFVKYTK